MSDLIPDEERAERVREYLARRREVTPMIDGERFDTIHDIDLGSAGHVRLLASDLEVLARRPSTVTREALGKLIWDTSHADEGTISVTGANIIADAILSRFSLPEPAEDELCREESCQYRHWRSGSMPTHKRGAGCPPPVPVKGTEQ